MVRWIRQSATNRRLLALFFMVLVFPLMILPWAAERFAAYSGGGQPLDVSFGFSPGERSTSSFSSPATSLGRSSLPCF
jgi:hypothetical protein